MRLIADLGLDPKRIIPVTRSGAAAWYGAEKAVELHAMRTPHELRVQNRLRYLKEGAMKPRSISAFDRHILADVVETLALTEYHVIHPSWMYHLLAPFWHGDKGFNWLAARVAWKPLPVEAPPPNLPKTFVAARFYARYTWPQHAETTAFALASLKRLSQNQPVVLLNTGQHVDEHIDMECDLLNVTRITDYMTVNNENTLLAQSAVLKQALGFVGTYGGLAQLALMLGKPSITFYTEWAGTALPHRHLSTELSVKTGIPFVVHRLGDLPMMAEAIPNMAMTPSPVNIEEAQPV